MNAFQVIYEKLKPSLNENWTKLILNANTLESSELKLILFEQDDLVELEDNSFVVFNENTGFSNNSVSEKVIKSIRGVMEIVRTENIVGGRFPNSVTVEFDRNGKAVVSSEFIDRSIDLTEYIKEDATTSLFTEAKVIKWFFIKPLVNSEVLDEFEKNHKMKFEPYFKDFFLKFNGASPDRTQFRIPFVGKFQFRQMLSFNPSTTDSNEKLVEPALTFFREKLNLTKLLPFGMVDISNYLALDNQYRVIYVNAKTGKSILIAQSFEKFLRKLTF